MPATATPTQSKYKLKSSSVRVLDLHAEGMTTREISETMTREGTPMAQKSVCHVLRRRGLRPHPPKRVNVYRSEYKSDEPDATIDERAVDAEIDLKAKAWRMFSMGGSVEHVVFECEVTTEKAEELLAEMPEDWLRLQ